MVTRKNAAARAWRRFAAAGLAMAVAAGAAAGEPVVFGVVLPLTGQHEAHGQSILSGMRVRADELNAQGGILGGRRVELRVLDDESSLVKVVADVESLAAQSDVLVILGPHNSGELAAMREPALRLKIPVIAPKATQNDLTNANPYIFRITFSNGFQGIAMAQFLVRNLKFNRLALLYDKTQAYTVSLAENFREAADDAGATLVADLAYEETAHDGRTDYRPLIKKLIDAKPDAVFVPAYAEEVQAIVRQAGELGLDAVLCGGDSWDIEPVFLGSGWRLEGSYFIASFSAEDPSELVQNFLEAMQRAGQDHPESASALGYDSVSTAALALERADEPTREGLRKALHTFRKVPLVTGETTITDEGDAIKSVYLMQVVKGEDGAFTVRTKARLDP